MLTIVSQPEDLRKALLAIPAYALLGAALLKRSADSPPSQAEIIQATQELKDYQQATAQIIRAIAPLRATALPLDLDFGL